MKYHMDVEYSDAKKPKPKTKPYYINDHKRTYGFHTEEDRKHYRRGIEAASMVYDFDMDVKEYDEETDEDRRERVARDKANIQRVDNEITK